MRATWALVLLSLTACDDYLFGQLVDGTVPDVEGYAGVQEIVAAQCFGCHGAEAPLGGLDLETDLHTATVGVVGQYQIPIVLAGDPDNSMLYLKVANAHPPNTGTDMPPGSGGLALASTNIVRDWIEAGAPLGEGTPIDDTGR